MAENTPATHTYFEAIIAGQVWAGYGATMPATKTISEIDPEHKGITNDQAVDYFRRTQNFGDFEGIHDAEVYRVEVTRIFEGDEVLSLETVRTVRRLLHRPTGKAAKMIAEAYERHGL